MIKTPTLSFCITCKDRFYQISKTLKQNLEDNRLHRDLIEFVLVDFGSNDGLRDWILSNFLEDLESGYLKYYYTEEQPYWHAAICKNTPHYCANNDIVVNLDCDNYVGFLGGQYVIRQFMENRNILFHQFLGDLSDGTFGRIALMKEHFEFIGGYNESLERLGFEDLDLIERLQAIYLKYVRSSNRRFCSAIRNPSPEGFDELNIINSLKSKSNINEGRIIANNGIYGIRNNLFDYRGKLFQKSTSAGLSNYQAGSFGSRGKNKEPKLN